MNFGGTNLTQDIMYVLLLAVFTVPTVLIVNSINKKGLAGLIPVKNNSRNVLAYIGGILCLIPPGFIIGLPMIYIARAQMRYSFEKGQKFTSVILIILYSIIAIGALTWLATPTMNGLGY